MEKIYYTIYKITNLNSGKIYIGKHKTKNLDDNYMGSGTDIQYAIMSEGKENFKKEIIEIFDTEKEMIDKEKEIVTEDFVKSETTYNRAVAGGYTWSGIRGPKEESYHKLIANRPQCTKCNKRPRAVNYYRKGKVYYRKNCNWCDLSTQKEKKNQKDQAVQLLKKSGYKKKTVCDRCGFVAKTSEQTKIHFRDGNVYNVSLSNLRSYCINCVVEISNNPGSDKMTILPDY